MLEWLTKQKERIVQSLGSGGMYVEVEPTELMDTSTTITLTVYTSREKQSIVACSYKWFRKRGSISNEAEQFRGNCFICQPSDVGALIIVVINDLQSTTHQQLQFGPLRLHATLRHSVAAVLSSGEYMTRADLATEEGVKECLLRVREDTIKLSHCSSMASFKFVYDLTEPIIQVNVRDGGTMVMTFTQKYALEQNRFFSQMQARESQLVLTFVSKQAKQQCFMVIKAFNTKREMKTSALIRKIEKTDYSDESLEPFLQLEGLSSDIRKINAILKKKQGEINVLESENARLQQQITNTITSYTAIIENKFKNKEEVERNKIRRLEEQNKYLKQKVSIRDQISQSAFQDGLPIQKVSPFSKKQANEQLQYSYQEPRQSLYKNEDQFSQSNEKKRNSFKKAGSNKERENKIQYLLQDNTIQLSGFDNFVQHQIKQRYDSPQRNIKRSEGNTFQSPSQEYKIQSPGEGNKLQSPNDLRLSSATNSSYVSSLHQSLSPRSKHSALQISLNKVLQDKIFLEQKYDKLKTEYRKIKNPQQSAGHSSKGTKNESEEEREKKEKIAYLQDTLKKEREEHAGQLRRREAKIKELKEEIKLVQKGQQMLNRSQMLSQEMESYSMEESTALKAHNEFLIQENKRLIGMCDRYKMETKELRELLKRLNTVQQ